MLPTDGLSFRGVMDLSQQELPLTAYFARGSKETRSRTVPHNDGRSAEDSHPSSKRGKSDVRSSTTTPLNGSAGRSKSRRKTVQLPTPATSTRKRNERLSSSAKTPPTSTDASSAPVEQSAILPKEMDFAELESGPTPSKPSLSRQAAQDAIPLATPSTDRRRTTKSLAIEFCPGQRRSHHEQTGIATPRTLPRRVCEPMQGNNRSQVPPTPLDLGVSEVVYPLEPSNRATAGPPCLPVELDSVDPFHAGMNSRVVAQQSGAFTEASKQCFMQSNQTSDGRAIPILPVPSSQSQYLLRLDATPKRKRFSQPAESVISSQTQEERELMLSIHHGPSTLSTGVSPGRYARGNVQTPRLGCSERKTQHVYTLASTPAVSPNSSPFGPSRSFFASKKALDKLSPKFTSPSRRERVHSPDRKAKTPRRPRCDSIENVPPPHIEDSLTESESESDMLHLLMKDKLLAPGPPSQGISSAIHDLSPLARHGSAGGSLPGGEDDSATEAESDTEILHCVAEISRKRRRSEASREDTPRRPVVSPLVSPARSRIAPMPSIAGRFLMEEGAGRSIPKSGTPYSSTTQPQIPSQSLPSVVRDFIRMFPGDESYPADFPESLRV